jgi:hypothetical protein
MGTIIVFVLFYIGVIVFDFVTENEVDLKSSSYLFFCLLKTLYVLGSFMVIMFILTEFGGCG